MRIFGDNSDGFQNEINIEKSLNEKIYDKLNPNLKHFLDDIFRGYNLKGRRIHAIRSKQNVKPDFYLHIDGIPKEVYISVKQGSGNSVHQEKLSLFVDFLKKEGIPENVIKSLKLYHYSDGTIDNTGEIRKDSKKFLKENPDILDILNEYFSDENFVEKLFYRFVFTGNIEDAPTTDYLYHGNVSSGVWASREEILKYQKEKSKKDSKAFCIGLLTYQTWNKNLRRNPNTENRRDVLQLKWGSMESDLIKITSYRDLYKQKGTYEGNLDEKSNVIYFNRNPEDNSFKKYLEIINSKPENTLLVRVTTNQFSKLSNQKVKTRADAYAIKILDKQIFSVLEENQFYLDESILENYTEFYTFIPESGISIKMSDSDDFTIIKFTPNSFFKVFNSFALGAGASLFCKKQEELFKNKNLLEGWKTTFDELHKIVPNISFTENSLTTSLDVCKKIKNTTIICIRKIIESSDEIKKLIFNGIGVYEEPYTAFFLMQGNEIQQLVYIEYDITTGSGRSKGIYSIVLKPRKNNTNLQNYNLIQNEDNYLVADNNNDFSYI